MISLRGMVRGATVALALTVVSSAASAAPTLAARGGNTSVELAPSFLAALTSLGVAPGPVFPGRIEAETQGVFARFPITTGAIDAGTVKAEIDHSGGLSLTAGKTRVELTDFIIDLTGTAPVLTGLVTVDGNLLTRLPLFDLNLSSSTVKAREPRVNVSNVAVTLDAGAASALNGVFHITALSGGLSIGTATVRALVEGDGRE